MKALTFKSPKQWPSITENFWPANEIWNDFNLHSTAPLVNVEATDEAYFIELAVPGFKKDQIKLDLTDNVLTITGKVEHSETEEKRNFTKREFRFESFKRAFEIPESVNQDEIDANYQDGVLKITLHKKEEAKPKAPKVIDIK